MQSPTKLLSPIILSIPAPVQVLIAILSIQLGAAFAINLFSVFGAVGTVFFRLVISAFLLFILIRPKFTREALSQYKTILTYGITLGLMNWCFYEAIARIPLGLTVAIEFMGPLLVGALSSKRRIDLLWIAIAVVGLLILTPNIGNDIDLIGVMYACVAGVGWGGFVILSKRINVAIPGNDGLVFGMIAASIFMFPFAVTSISPAFTGIGLAGSLIFLAILSTTIPFYLEFSALKKLTAQTYGVLITLEPAVAAIIGVLVLGDTLGVKGIVAIVCVTIAAFGATLTQEKFDTPE